MELYRFVWQALAWSITVAVLWPVMFPWAKLAYKIWHGNKPIDEDLADELWTRSALATLVIALLAVLLGVLDYFCADADWLGLPAGPIHIVFLLSFVSAAAGIMMYFFSMEDFFQGLSLTVIYLYIPTALLYVASLLFANPLQVYVLKWLVQPPA